MIDSAVNSLLEVFRTPAILNLSTLISLSVYVIAALAITYFLYKKKNKLALVTGICYAAVFILIELLKRIVGRIRPDGSDALSFPSRHTAFAFFIALTFPTNRAGKIALYSWATLVGLSRLTLAEHWLTDVVFGAGLGLLAGSAYTRVLVSKLQKKSG